jgi:hypothetical protein
LLAGRFSARDAFRDPWFSPSFRGGPVGPGNAGAQEGAFPQNPNS